MRKFVVISGALLLLAALLSIVVSGTQVVSAQEGGPPAAHAAITEYTGPETCGQCHPAAAQQVVDSVHYQLMADATIYVDREEGTPGGMLNVYSMPEASTAAINWLALVQPQDASLAVTAGGCALCHAGQGAQPNQPLTEEDLANVDCLICHGPDYERTVVETEGGELRFAPVEGLGLLAAAQAAQRPTNEMCARCHLDASTGPNFKHGDYPTSPEVDVHLAAGVQCLDCHPTEEHKIGGAGDLAAQGLPQVAVACANCHGAQPHTGDNGAILNSIHVNRVACQTCHIPSVARDPAYPTQITRDFSQPTLDEVTGLYEPQFTVENDVTPVYFWWTDHQMEMPSKPVGSIDDADARITPWKPVEVTIPVDAETESPLPIKEDVYSVQGNLEAAVTAGVEAAGIETSGAPETAAQTVYFDVNHQVAPAAESLKCADCHTEDGRLDFAALGYSEERTARLVAVGAPPPTPTATPEAEPTQEAAEEPAQEGAEGATPEPVDEPAAEPTPAPGPQEAGIVNNETCLACHATQGMTTELPNGDVLYLTIDAEGYAESVHGVQGYACVQCHTDITGFPHPAVQAESRREFALERYRESCVQCHPDMYEQTLDSVHQKALAAGNDEAAICTDCHGSHYVQSPHEPLSASSQMCDKCHSEIYDLYHASVHGSALIDEGNPDVPSCIDCHGVHSLEGPSRYATFHLRSPEICADCHNDPTLMAKYGLNADVYETYLSDFHGATVVLFQETTPDQPTDKAVCVDCHGVHDIQSVDDPESRVIKANVLETCQRCHPDATANFPASWLGHYQPDPEKAPIVYFVNLFYKILIPAVLGGMVVFNLTDLGRSVVARIRGRKE
jgi:hypothetical protein